YNTVKDGFCDAGWKDTVLIYPGERIRLLMRWTQHRGTYVYHCHNLEHEDHGMMLNYRVE
ncbi:MAG: multicopper oxidase domain-containing protein, partial [Phycisphaerales bacterium]|nr:multicopper oxidase domain-containing protein [Phycisphaerales bacterium]